MVEAGLGDFLVAVLAMGLSLTLLMTLLVLFTEFIEGLWDSVPLLTWTSAGLLCIGFWYRFYKGVYWVIEKLN
jgi:hypothetical protein